MQGEKLGLEMTCDTFSDQETKTEPKPAKPETFVIAQVLSFIVVLPFAKSAGARGSNNSRSSYRKQTESKMHSVPFARRVQRGVDNLQVIMRVL